MVAAQLTTCMTLVLKLASQLSGTLWTPGYVGYPMIADLEKHASRILL